MIYKFSFVQEKFLKPLLQALHESSFVPQVYEIISFYTYNFSSGFLIEYFKDNTKT